MITRIQKKKIFVGLSGGVDSAVSAALLLREGYEVVGVFIKTWHPEGFPCTEPEDRRSAMRVATHLGIPFTTLDLAEEYKRGVADEMLAEYARGRTPNPDTLCNKIVKFGAFHSFAKAEGAGCIATGHYVRTARKGEETHLLSGVDPDKDQSYFLWMLEERVLADSLFPIGGFTKRQVRMLARTHKLPNAERPDSQGVCFLGEVSMPAFLKAFLPLAPGNVLDEEGKIIGKHEGAALYTMGQRHGFSIFHTGPHDAPRYVIAKDIEQNSITVSPRETPRTVGLSLIRTNWIGTVSSGSYRARFRYRQPLQGAELLLVKDETQVALEKASFVPLGQSLVLYEGERLLGGGIINSVA